MAASQTPQPRAGRRFSHLRGHPVRARTRRVLRRYRPSPDPAVAPSSDERRLPAGHGGKPEVQHVLGRYFPRQHVPVHGPRALHTLALLPEEPHSMVGEASPGHLPDGFWHLQPRRGHHRSSSARPSPRQRDSAARAMDLLGSRVLVWGAAMLIGGWALLKAGKRETANLSAEPNRA